MLAAGTRALEGKGELGNEMITKLAAAAETFGEGSGPLFETVSQLARFTTTLAKNDKVVRAFVKDLAGVSDQLAGERAEISAALASVADAVGTVKTFVRDNREALVSDVEKLTRVMRTINSEKDSIDTALEVAPVAIGNLTLAYNQKSGSIGSRIGLSGNVWDADGFLCALVQQSQLPSVSKSLACQLFKQLLEPVEDQLPSIPPATGGAPAASPGSGAARVQREDAQSSTPSLSQLMGGE